MVNNGEKTHMVSFPVANEEEGKRFINRFNITESFSKKHLFLSANRTMENTFMCGNAKSFKVTTQFYCSAHSHFTPTHWSKSYKNGHKISCSWLRNNWLIWCISWWMEPETLIELMKKLEISDPHRSSWMRVRGESNWLTSSQHQTSTPGSKKLSNSRNVHI